MPTYNKLVRDLIPNIIRATGLTCRTRQLDAEEHLQALRVKLLEEVEAFLNTERTAESVEELADILEILFALAQKYGADEDELLEIRDAKRDERGGFDEGIYLIEVSDA